jgi:NAD(P)-dependent dehydrogenase (short-subunit alcohol dehydrogenase family)
VSTGIQGKVAIVTGGASGIGRATALAFAREGAKVAVVTARSLAKGEEVARQIEDSGGRAICIQCDVSKEDQVAAMVAQVLAEFGRLDFAFNNAGVGPDGVTIPFAPLTDLTEADWDVVLDTNLKGVFLCMKHELRHMTKQRAGVIVNTSSTAAMFAKPGFGGYCPAKAGINSVSKVAAQETKALGIRVNVICPGPTKDTGMSDRLLSALKTDLISVMGAPDDVARVVVWLCSDEASFVNGQVISVDGGLDLA